MADAMYESNFHPPAWNLSCDNNLCFIIKGIKVKFHRKPLGIVIDTSIFMRFSSKNDKK